MSDEESGDDKTMIMSPSVLRRQPAPKAKLVCVDTSVLQDSGGTEIRLDGKEVFVGRGEENDVVLKADGISRRHAKIFPADEVWGIEDLGSTNGVRVNNSKVSQAWLRPGDTVAIGRVGYKYSVEATPETTERTSAPQLDLGDDRTMVMRPAAPASAAARPAAGAKPAAKPAARPAAHAAPAKSGAGGMLWVVVGVGVVLVAVAAFLMLHR